MEQEKSTAKRERKIEEITITARRTEESLQTTPVTMTAFGAEELAENDICAAWAMAT